MGVIITESPVHQLVEQKRADKGYSVVGRCGIEVHRGVDLPENFTGWHGSVTCQTCLNPTATRGTT